MDTIHVYTRDKEQFVFNDTIIDWNWNENNPAEYLVRQKNRDGDYLVAGLFPKVNVLAIKITH